MDLSVGRQVTLKAQINAAVAQVNSAVGTVSLAFLLTQFWYWYQPHAFPRTREQVGMPTLLLFVKLYIVSAVLLAVSERLLEKYRIFPGITARYQRKGRRIALMSTHEVFRSVFSRPVRELIGLLTFTPLFFVYLTQGLRPIMEGTGWGFLIPLIAAMGGWKTAAEASIEGISPWERTFAKPLTSSLFS